jgi:hypothetical protein
VGSRGGAAPATDSVVRSMLLFHGTAVELRSSIELRGLVPSMEWGSVFLAPSEDDAKRYGSGHAWDARERGRPALSLLVVVEVPDESVVRVRPLWQPWEPDQFMVPRVDASAVRELREVLHDLGPIGARIVASGTAHGLRIDRQRRRALLSR